MSHEAEGPAVAARIKTYPKYETTPLVLQLGHKFFPGYLNDDFICPQFFHFPQMNLRREEE